jgi:3-phosphoshikimate 1-carboxyvinyltransferase
MNRPLLGTVRVVPDKSITHRGVLLAALARGRSVVHDPNPGADCAATLRAVEALGVTVCRPSGCWVIEADGLHEPGDILDLGNSGTGLRLLAGVLAAHPFFAVLTGDRSLRSRPMERIIRPLEAMGAHIDAREGMRAPLAVRGAVPRGLDFENSTGSAQVKSAVLLAGLGLREGSVRVRERWPSRDHTERMLAWMGAPVHASQVASGDPGVRTSSGPRSLDRENHDPPGHGQDSRGQGNGDDFYTVRLDAGAELVGREWRVPGDISAALFPLVAAAITPGSRVTVEGIGLNPTRTGALDVLQRMGARLEIRPDPDAGPEPTGSVTIEYGPLRAVEVGGGEVPRLIDEVPVLAVAAACADGVSHFAGVGELRVKESDRVRSTCFLLRALGVEVDEEPEGFFVHGGRGLHGGHVESHDDHRIAMSALVAGCAADGEVSVDSLAMVDTSDPGFLARLALLRGERP